MLFAYGTLQDADVLGAVLGRAVDVAELRPATAKGFRVVFYPGRPYPALVASQHDQAAGLLIEELEAADLAVLDAFEGDEYRRTSILVTVAGHDLHADAYLPTIALDAMSTGWSLDHWQRQHKPTVLAGEIDTARTLRDRLTR